LSNRLTFGLAVLLLLAGAALRLWNITTLPPGLNSNEIVNVRIAETIRQGRVEVFYDLGGTGHEGLFPGLLAAVTGVTGGGLIGYRILSILMGMLVLALIYALGKRLFGAPAGLAALALLTVVMFSNVLSRAVVPETLLPLFLTAVLLALALALPVYGRRHEPGVTPFAALGVLLGIGFYLHPINFFITLLAMLFIAFMILSRQPLTRRTLSLIWFAVVILIVIATPYLTSSLQLPELAGAGRVFARNITMPLRSFVDGVSGLFFEGDTNATWNLPGRPMFDLVSGLLVVVGLAVALRYWRQPRFALLLLGVLLLAPIAFIRDSSPNFLYYAPLLPLLALLFGLGVTTLYRSLRDPGARRIGTLALALLVIFNLQWTVRDFFFAWAQNPEMQEAYNARVGMLAHYLDLTSDDIPSVICTSVLRPPNAPVVLTSTQLLALMMHRSDAVLRYADCGTGLIFTQGGALEQIVMPEENALVSMDPYLQEWVARGELLTEPDLPPNSVVMLDVEDELADMIGMFTTTAPVAYAPESPGGTNVTAPPVRFGGNVTFLGYERSYLGTFAPGDVLTVITYWRVDGVVPTDLRLFTHVQADPGAIPVAQNDAISVLPEQLRPRDVFIQVTFVQLPRTMPDGAYSVSVGAYEGTTGMRLPVFDGDQPRGTRLFIGQIVIQGN
jgi:4-amino-4-deoxy-L-arabinose transferase-like glycosyltransferase